MKISEHINVGDILSFGDYPTQWRAIEVADGCVKVEKITATFPPMTGTIKPINPIDPGLSTADQTINQRFEFDTVDEFEAYLNGVLKLD